MLKEKDFFFKSQIKLIKAFWTEIAKSSNTQQSGIKHGSEKDFAMIMTFK